MGSHLDHINTIVFHPSYYYRQHSGDSQRIHVQAPKDRAKFFYHIPGRCRFNSCYIGYAVECGLFDIRKMDIW